MSTARSAGKGLLVGPLAAIGLPLLLAPNETAIPRLEAVQQGTRSLAGVLTLGTGLEQAIIVTGPAGQLPARNPTDVALHRSADG